MTLNQVKNLAIYVNTDLTKFFFIFFSLSKTDGKKCRLYINEHGRCKMIK